MASYALIRFRINNDFFEWEQAFYTAQPMARNAGIIELFHGKVTIMRGGYGLKLFLSCLILKL